MSEPDVFSRYFGMPDRPEAMSDADRIARLEHVLGTLINWIHGTALRPNDAATLLQMLESEKPVKAPK